MAGAALAHGRAPAAVLARDCTSALNDIAACLALGCAYCCDSNLCVDGVPPDCTTVATSTSGPGGCGGTSGPTGTPSPAASRWVAAFLLSLVVLPMVALILAVVGVSATRAWRRYLERKRLHPQPPLPGTAAAALPADDFPPPPLEDDAAGPGRGRPSNGTALAPVPLITPP